MMRITSFVVVVCAASAAAQPVPATAKVSTVKESARADALAAEEAEKAKAERDARAPTIVQEEERAKVEVDTDPGLRYEDYRRQTEFKVASKRKELISYLDQILSTNPPAEERPELLFQKGELFLEEAQFHFFEANRMDDEIAAALGAGDDAKMTAASEKKDQAAERSKRWGQDAIKIFEEIEKKYPKFERLADVLYMMGQAYWDRSDYKDALRTYRKLIKDHSKSQYISDAWLAFGEFYFQVADENERDVKKALDSYVEAAKNQESQVFGYATYKQGWCYYNLSRFDKSAERFKEVVLYSQVNSDILGNRRIGLAKEARKDYVLAYAQYGEAGRAPSEFRVIADGDEHRAMLERLADIYYGDGKDRDAIITYTTLMKDTPENTRNALYQGKVVKLASRIGEKRQVVGHSRKLVEEYKRVRSVLKNMPATDKKRGVVEEDLAAADSISDNTLRFLATTWHKEAKKTLDNSTFEYSHEIYGDFLELFPERKEAYDMRFFYAELLFQLERYELAGEQYVRVFQQDPKGKWAEVAAEEAVRAYDNVNQDYDRAQRAKTQPPPAPGDALKERALPDVKKKYIAACNNYLGAFPNGKSSIEALYKVARTLYDFNYFKDSTPRFMELVEKHPEHARAEQAANLVLDTYNLLENWADMNAAARTFSKNAGLMKNKEFRETLNKVLEESTFKLISDFEKKKDWAEAAKRYLAFAEEFPSSALADKALANSAATFTRAGQLDRAIKVRQKLVSDYKDSPLVPDQVFSIAAGYEQIVAYRDAAQWLERFAETYPKDERAKDALYNASIYRHGTNDTKKAVEDRKAYLKAYPTAKDTEDVAHSIAVAWDEANKPREAVEAYREFSAKYVRTNPARSLNALYRALRLLEQSKGSKADIEQTYKSMTAQAAAFQRSGKPLDEVGDPLALIAFREADEVLERYKDIKIAKADKPADFKKSLQAKREAKNAVDAAYTKVVELRSAEWAVASLYRIGDADANLIRVFNDVKPPKDLTDEQAQVFKDKMGEQILPIEEHAAATMELCLQKSAQYAVFNEWTKRCLSYLEENRPNQYPKNSAEERSVLRVVDPRNEQGVGVVVELPKPGEKPKGKPGTEPPPPPRTTTKPATTELTAGDLAGAQ
jgi:TolA-binding protein